MAQVHRPRWRGKWDQQNVKHAHGKAGAAVILLALAIGPTVGWIPAAIAAFVAGHVVDRHFGL